MREIVFKCRRHGDRIEEEVYRSNDKATLKGFRYKCKECTYEATRKRPCKIHGNISDEDRLGSGKCRICSLSTFRTWNTSRNSDRETFNGLTVEQYQQMFIDQNNKCAICHEDDTKICTQRSKDKEMQIAKLCLDHNHETGNYRELLCHDCNTMLGKAYEDINILQSAIQYLIKHQATDGSNLGAINDDQNQ